MLFSILKWTIISLTLIFLVHHLYLFLMNTLTVPKIRDLVNKPNEQYNDIYATLQKSGQGHKQVQGQEHNQSTTVAQASVAHASMTEELTQFLNDLKKTPAPTGVPTPTGVPANVKYNNNNNNNNDSTTPIGELPTSGNYSAY